MRAAYDICKGAYQQAKVLSNQNYKAVGSTLAAYINHKTNANLDAHKVASAMYSSSKDHLSTTRSARNAARAAYREACMTPPTPTAERAVQCSVPVPAPAPVDEAKLQRKIAKKEERAIAKQEACETAKQAAIETARTAAIKARHDALLNTVREHINSLVTSQVKGSPDTQVVDLREVSDGILQALAHLIQHPTTHEFPMFNANREDRSVCTVNRHLAGFYYERSKSVYCPVKMCKDRIVTMRMDFSLRTRLSH